MKHIAQQIVLVLAILALPFYQANARYITHNFEEKYGSTLTIEGANKIGTSTDDGIVYTCAGAADFRHDSEWVLSLRLKDENDSVTISPPLNKLSAIQIWRLPEAINKHTVGVAYSRDGSTWTEILPENIDKSNGAYVIVPLPVSAFYIKIYNPRATTLTIRQIIYSFLDCNCFTFMPE